MYACHACDRSERYARRCPKQPLEWAALERQGVAFEGSNPERVAKGLQAQMDAHPGWDPELRGKVTEEYEELMGRVYAERDYGPFGEDHPDYPLCAWYAMEQAQPWVNWALSQVRLDTNYRPVLWKEGGIHDQDCVLVDCMDVVRLEHGKIDRERLRAPTKTQGGGADG